MIAVIIPASNEEKLIGSCLSALLASDAIAVPVEIIVAANGCKDETARISESFRSDAEDRGWSLTVLDLAEGGKLNALNVADATAQSSMRVYLDADVTVSPALLNQIHQVLDRPEPVYTSGRLQIAPSSSWVSRRYRAFYQNVPFMRNGVPGCGIFAVNGPGRAKWGTFPDIISDDTYVRLQFSADERIGVPASYQWPIVEGFSNLVTVRMRQDAGVREVAEKYPAMLKNDDKLPVGFLQLLGMVFRQPLGFAIYSSVALVVRVKLRSDHAEWSRGR